MAVVRHRPERETSSRASPFRTREVTTTAGGDKGGGGKKVRG